MKVNFINNSYRRFYSANKKEIDNAVTRCLSEGQLTLRRDVWDLEKNIAKYVGVKYGAGVNSGTDALFLSLLALGIGKGDEVITVSNTFIATIQAIVHTGATPILIDVSWDEQMDVSKIEDVITKNTKAIIPVHYTGAMCDMKKIMAIAKKHKIHVVEDACQALGAKQNGKMAGSFGILSCFSFNTAKLLGGLCDGGMVVTNDRKLWEKICLLRNHWNVHQLSVDRKDYPQPEEMQWAWKSRLSNVNAAFLNVKFKKLGQILKRRKEIAEMYLEGLKNVGKLYLPKGRKKGEIWQEFHVGVGSRRSEFAKFLEKNGIETLTRDVVPNHKMKGLGLCCFNLLATERFARSITRLPLYPEMTDAEVKYAIKTVREFYEE